MKDSCVSSIAANFIRDFKTFLVSFFDALVLTFCIPIFLIFYIFPIHRYLDQIYLALHKNKFIVIHDRVPLELHPYEIPPPSIPTYPWRGGGAQNHFKGLVKLYEKTHFNPT